MLPPPDQPSEAEGPDVLVSVDVANVGALWTRDPELTWEALNQLEDLLETMLDDLGGTVTDHDGDGFILRFPTAAPAVMWCARMQEGLLALDWPDALAGTPDGVGVQEMLFGGLLARMAIHRGSLEELLDLVSLTHSGQVLISTPTFNAITEPIPPDLQVTSIGTVSSGAGLLEVSQVTTRLLSRRRFASLASHTSRIPFASSCFVGRRQAMAVLKEHMNAGARMVNITSSDGLGKTRLALLWARAVEPITAGGVAWAALHGTRDTTDLLLCTAVALGMSLGTKSEGSLVERIGHAIAARGSCIVVFDDFEDHLDLSVLTTWVRVAPNARFVVTSTHPLQTELSTHLHLEELSQPEAKALYLARTHRQMRFQDRPAHASQVNTPQVLDSHPAQIEQAAGLSGPRWPTHTQPVLMLRHTAMDATASATDRVQAALELAPVLGRMGLNDIAGTLLRSVENALRTLADPHLDERWRGALTDTLIAGGDWIAAHELLDPIGCDEGSAQGLLRKGQLALAENQPEEAVELLNRAVELDNSGEISLTLGKALAEVGAWEDALIHLGHASQQISKPIEKGWALAALGRVQQDLARDTDANQSFEQAFKLGGEDVHLIATLHHHRFEGASARLALDEAAEHLNRAVILLRRCGDRSATVSSLNLAGVLSLVRHDPEGAMGHLIEAREICRADGLAHLEAHTLLTTGIAARVMGDLGSALDSFAEAVALGEGDRPLLSLIHAHRAAAEAACDAIGNAESAFATAEVYLSDGWDALASTIHDMLMGFLDLAKARDAALDEDGPAQTEHFDRALNRLARGSSFETRSTPPRGRETPSRINDLRLARLLLDGAISTMHPEGRDLF
jgi:tetratricopeptide (TPR) repeat protein